MKITIEKNIPAEPKHLSYDEILKTPGVYKALDKMAYYVRVVVVKAEYGTNIALIVWEEKVLENICRCVPLASAQNSRLFMEEATKYIRMDEKVSLVFGE